MNGTARTPTERELAHERLGRRFEQLVSGYDTQRRIEVLVDDFLGGQIAGQSVLDVGCGLGYFSERLVSHGARVTACDIGPGLVETAARRAGCTGVVADALALTATFEPGSFDVVLSSECVEHTPAPRDAIAQMAAVLRPGGRLVLSTPNTLWRPVVRLANATHLRAFRGYENFSTWAGIRSVLARNGIATLREQGLHLFPFQLGLHGVLRWCDRHLQGMRVLMINICILGRKQG